VTAPTRRWAHGLASFALLSIVVGAALRFTWPDEIEFKHDERFMFERSQHVGVDEPWSWLGMPSGVGLRNAGLSIWIFVALARVLHVTTPSGLAMSVAALSIVALALFFVLAMRVVAEPERERWLWTIALAAVNPISIAMERKIWAQSVLPVFVALFWLAWWRRDRVWGAFVWGLVGALVGQVHMSGVFFAAGVFAWEALSGWRARRLGSTWWGAWFAGSIVGALPMIPWALYLATAASDHTNHFDIGEIFTPRIWYFGATDAVGLGLHANLGAKSFVEFLRAPWIGDVPTYGVALLHVVVAVVAVGLVILALRRAWRAPKSIFIADDATGNALRAVWIGYGVVLTLSGALLYRHYLAVAFPFESLLVASVALGGRGRKLLPVLWAGHVAVTIAFLVFIHAHHGALGDYGIGLTWQTAADAAVEPYK
jgi:hypothetical protein